MAKKQDKLEREPSEQEQSDSEQCRLKRSIFMQIAAPVILLVTIIFILIACVYDQGEHSNVLTREKSVLDISATALTRDFNTIISDLKLLRHNLSLKRYLEEADIWALRDLKEEMLMFAKEKLIHEQIRYIDTDGNEIVRIQREQERAEIVSDSTLQNKSERYYFRETLPLDDGEIYISPLDLNV